MLKIIISSTLREYLPVYDPVKGVDFAIDGQMTVADLCRQLRIPPDKVKIVMVNGKSEGLDYLIQGNERIALFPPVGGG
ncbi:MAG: MoaD/ThiS family protein [Thermodesulfobacteriota bacterium]|nr:MoaD/ThiS family protein [Thermodesulfobacteriota bacterium]